jgi:hypothetical protein
MGCVCEVSYGLQDEWNRRKNMFECANTRELTDLDLAFYVKEH